MGERALSIYNEFAINDLISSKVCDNSLKYLGGRRNSHTNPLKEEMDMKKRWTAAMMVLVFLAAGSAFGAEPIKLGMSTWLGYAPLYLAKEKGFFKKQGVEGGGVGIER